jgi:hypothetical protein
MTDYTIDTTPNLAGISAGLNIRGTMFVKDVLLSYRFAFGPWEARLTVQDVANAGKTGKTCARGTVEFSQKDPNSSDALQGLMDFVRAHDGDFRKILETIAQKPYGMRGGYRESHHEGNATFHFATEQANRVYSPFATYKPLTEKPAKWTLTHAIRALWNGQAENLQCNGRYTDDYAYDAASNYGKGAISNARAFAKQLIESPSGWRAVDEGENGMVGVHCHSFLYNNFRLNLAGAKAPAPAGVAA